MCVYKRTNSSSDSARENSKALRKSTNSARIYARVRRRPWSSIAGAADCPSALARCEERVNPSNSASVGASGTSKNNRGAITFQDDSIGTGARCTQTFSGDGLTALNEQSLRRFVAMKARAPRRGRVSLMSRINGLARSTIYHRLSDIRDHVSVPSGCVHKPGGSREKKSSEDPMWSISRA